MTRTQGNFKILDEATQPLGSYQAQNNFHYRMDLLLCNKPHINMIASLHRYKVAPFGPHSDLFNTLGASTIGDAYQA